MLPAIAEFFKTTFDASLAKLVQPAAVVPSAVFVLLNVLLVHPTLVAAGVGPFVAVEALPDLLKVAALVALILLLGYVILALNSTLLRLATGELWRGSALYERMLNRASMRLAALEDALNTAWAEGNDDQAAWFEYEIKRWPAKAQLAPTRLGNALGSSATAIYQRYGIDMNACWPPLQSLVAKESAALATLVDDARESLDLLLNLSVILALFGLEALLVHAVYGDFQGAAYALLAFPVAYGCYRAAAARAVGWGNLIETAFDLHRDLLATKLGLRKTKDLADARKVWTSASAFLLYPKSSPGDAFAEPKKEEPVTATPSGNLQATKEFSDEVVVKDPPTGRRGSVEVAIRRTNLYTIRAKRRKGEDPILGHVRIVDSQSGRFAVPPQAADVDGRVGSVTAEVIGGDKPLTRSELLWHVLLARPTNALALRYDLPLATIKIEVQPAAWTVELDDGADPRNAIVKAKLTPPAAEPPVQPAPPAAEADAGVAAAPPAAEADAGVAAAPPAAEADAGVAAEAADPAVGGAAPAAEAQTPAPVAVTVMITWSRWNSGLPARLTHGSSGHLPPDQTVGNQRAWLLQLSSPTVIKLSSPEEPT